MEKIVHARISSQFWVARVPESSVYCTSTIMHVLTMLIDYLVTCEDNIRKNADTLDKWFRKLVKSTYNKIMEEKVDIDDIKLCLTNLPVRNRKQHEEFLKENWSKISNASQVRDIWFQLGYYWDFLNYSLLEYLINEFCEEQGSLVAMMEDYKMKLREFRCQTHLCDFAKHFKDVNKSLTEDNMKTFEVKLDKKLEQCTLQDLENWKENITQKLLLPSFVAKLHAIGPGCISVTWAIPTVFAVSLMESVETMDLADFCEEHGILSMKIDGKDSSTVTKALQNPKIPGWF